MMMPQPLPVGPYRTFQTAEGANFPYYLVPFDKDGTCEAPHTRNNLIGRAREFSDIFVFSQGWNNDWTAATKRYEDFITGFVRLRQDRGLPLPSGYKPLAVGLFWPSQALEWFESETGPDIAAMDPTTLNENMQETTRTIRDIATMLPPRQRPRFYELAQAPRLDPLGARELATVLASLAFVDDEGARAEAPSTDDLLAAAAAVEETEPDYDTVGTVTHTTAALDAAGNVPLLGFLDPRNLLKLFTVWQMKDRAGVVGGTGVSQLLVELLAHSTARIHLLGHSYGCKVVMTALCAPESVPRKVESALLLQGAVSHYGFAATVPGRNRPGAFCPAFDRVRRPILATFSPHDMALRHFFHLALRRHDDLGELQAAADEPPKYGALGGFGPQGANAAVTKIATPGTDYDLSGTGRVIGIDGTGMIRGHGDISQPATWWAEYQLVSAHMRYPG
jgi:hypothetical protein